MLCFALFIQRLTGRIFCHLIKDSYISCESIAKIIV